MPLKVAEAVRRRSGRRCELCRGARASQLHHRKLRSQGGKHREDNLLDLCPHCHHEVIHRNGPWARRHGLIVGRAYDPETIEPTLGCGLDCPRDHLDELS